MYAGRELPFTWLLLGGCFITAIVGILIFSFSDSAPVSFFGVSVMSGAMGLMTGPVLTHYQQAHVIQAALITAVIMVVMSVLGIMFPKVFIGWGSFLMAGLTVLIVAQFGQIIAISFGYPAAASMPILDWVGVLIFTGFIAYDWSEAVEGELTWDRAVDASGGLILNALNLFVRLLSISSSDDD
jgi:FtsH-binding integral membrane protein